MLFYDKVACVVKLIEEVTIWNPLGLHARPASQIVQMLKETDCRVCFKQGERIADAHSIVEVLMLAARPNSRLTIEVEGDRAEEVMQSLIDMFEEHSYGEKAE